MRSVEGSSSAVSSSVKYCGTGFQGRNASGSYDDKHYIESFFGHYKTEEVYRTSYTTLAESQVGWQLYRIWHETERVHESLDYETPHQRLSVSRSLTRAEP